MKKTFVVFALMGILVACGNNGNSGSGSSDTSSTGTNTPAASSDPAVAKGLSLAGKNGCFSCHKVSEQFTGPSYEAVAAKYANEDDHIVDTLAGRVIKGSSGHWGTIPMIPHPQVSEDDARSMVKYVLSLKK